MQSTNLNFPLSGHSGQKVSEGDEEVKRWVESRLRKRRKSSKKTGEEGKFRGNGERRSGRGVGGKLGV